MLILRYWLIALTVCFFAVAGRCQGGSSKSLKLSKVSLSYPSTWHLSRESRGAQIRITLTPDSMQRLTMRMCEIFELPVSDDHNYAYFKKNFASMLQPAIGSEGKILKTAEITFKEHKCMYADVIASSLPVKMYGIDAGNYIYLVLITQRRYSRIADPGLERDGNGILNSMVFGK